LAARDVSTTIAAARPEAEQRRRSAMEADMRFSASLFVLATVLAIPAQAADPDEDALDYSIESWDEHRGLPSTRIWAITQDNRGYLWLATQAGPLRFDGVRFELWRPDTSVEESEDLGVSALYEARDGTIWLTFYSGGIGRIRDGRLERYGNAAGIGPGRLVFLTQDTAGTIWAGNADTLYRFHDGRWDESGGWMGLPQAGAFAAH
jgi:ligand-binding sensor domain-containing protein